MARRSVRSSAKKVRNIEREVILNEQAYGTSASIDVLYTADDMVTLKRVIIDGMFAIGTVTSAGHAIGALYILPKDLANPTISNSDGELIYAAGLLVPIKFRWNTGSDGQVVMFEKDAKFYRKLQPGDRVVWLRRSTTDDLVHKDAIVVQMFFEH